MEVLLQSTKTALYLKRDLSWTPRLEDAFAFISSGEAIDFAFEHRLEEVQIVLFFKDLKHSLVVPFQSETAPELQRSTAASKLDRPEPR